MDLIPSKAYYAMSIPIWYIWIIVNLFTFHRSNFCIYGKFTGQPLQGILIHFRYSLEIFNTTFRAAIRYHFARRLCTCQWFCELRQQGSLENWNMRLAVNFSKWTLRGWWTTRIVRGREFCALSAQVSREQFELSVTRGQVLSALFITTAQESMVSKLR